MHTRIHSGPCILLLSPGRGLSSLPQDSAGLSGPALLEEQAAAARPPVSSFDTFPPTAPAFGS